MIESMAYQGQTPWHGLGNVMPTTANVPVALTSSGLDWTVDLKKMYYRHGDKHVAVPQRRAVVRSSDGKLLATVGKDYVPLQNTAAFEVLQPACEQFGVTIETAGSLGRGDRTWMLAKMADTVEPVAGDKVGGYVLVVNGHNGWTAYSARLTPVRVVCANTLALALKDHAFLKLTHVRDAASKLDQAARLVTLMVESLHQTGESFAKLAARKLTDEEIRQYVDEVLNIDVADMSPLQERRRDSVMTLAYTGKGVEYAPNTAWTAFNAVTEYIDHVRPAEAKSTKTIAAMNQSAVFGQNMKLKQRALVLARKLAA